MTHSLQTCSSCMLPSCTFLTRKASPIEARKTVGRQRIVKSTKRLRPLYIQAPQANEAQSCGRHVCLKVRMGVRALWCKVCLHRAPDRRVFAYPKSKTRCERTNETLRVFSSSIEKSALVRRCGSVCVFLVGRIFHVPQNLTYHNTYQCTYPQKDSLQ